tara:strand:- start:690 stop:1826 length:1137 start_codon:yes stop_codon:yes gene_type:complete
MFIGIAATIPDLANLPGQGGEGITVTLDYPSSDVCYDGTTSPSDASPAGGVFSYTGSGTLDLNTDNGAIDANSSDPGSYTVIYTKSGVSSSFPIVIGNDITLSITPVPGATICTGDTATLTANASGGSGSFSYLWSTTATTQAISVTTSGTYIVEVTDSNGCTATASQAITASTNATAIASVDNNDAMSFNGTDNFISASGNDISGNKTVSLWFYADDITLSDTLFEIQPVPNSNDYLRIWIFGSKILAASGPVNSNGKSSSTLLSNTWYHLVVAKTTGNVTNIYINGADDTQTANATLGFTAGDNGDTIIGRSATAGRFFKGKMDEVAIFNTALSSCDIKGIYEATTTVAGQAKSANLLDANTTIPAPIYWNRMGDS